MRWVTGVWQSKGQQKLFFFVLSNGKSEPIDEMPRAPTSWSIPGGLVAWNACGLARRSSRWTNKSRESFSNLIGCDGISSGLAHEFSRVSSQSIRCARTGKVLRSLAVCFVSFPRFCYEFSSCERRMKRKPTLGCHLRFVIERNVGGSSRAE